MDPSYYNVSYLATSADAWVAAAPLIEARSWAAVAALQGAHGETRIVAAGGMSLEPFFEPMASVEVYSPLSDTWTSAAGLPGSIGFLSGAAINATHVLVASG